MIKKNLDLVIVPCFCYAYESNGDEKKSKMNKLLDLWGKNKYFSELTIEKLRNPTVNWRLHEEMLAKENDKLTEGIEAESKGMLDTYEKQNNDFIAHSNNQINYIQMQINQIIQQQILVVS